MRSLKNKPGFNLLNLQIPLSPLPLHYLRKQVK
nr:MAG TPA: hypothetical protein [Caudoviricetes sp.]